MCSVIIAESTDCKIFAPCNVAGHEQVKGVLMAFWRVFDRVLVTFAAIAVATCAATFKFAAGGSVRSYSANVSLRKAFVPRAVVHIGPHKTGSSSIQEAMCRNEEFLRAHGWVLPICRHCGPCSAKVFVHIPSEIRPESVSNSRRTPGCDLPCTRDAILAQQNASIFLSSEELDKLHVAGVQVLAGLLANFSVTVVAFQRDKLATVASIYTEISKGSLDPNSFFDYIFRRGERQRGDGEKLDPGLYLDRVLATYSEVFGQENVVVVSYDGLRDKGIQPFQFIVREVLGITDVTEQQPSHNVNQGPVHGPQAVHLSALLMRLVSLQNRTAASVLPSCSLQHAESMLDRHRLQLPVVCSSLYGSFSSWQNAELDFLRRSQFQLFHFTWTPAEEREICTLDERQVWADWRNGSSSASALFKDAVAQVAANCSKKKQKSKLFKNKREVKDRLRLHHT